MMLMRIDDSSSTINVLSIPRDLEVNDPRRRGRYKLNAAYVDGGKDGANLLVKTLSTTCSRDLEVNHILVIDFQSFANLITSIGCVYGPVDHRYYNHSIGLAIRPPTTRASTSSPATRSSAGNNGGANSALAFVRFRHNDSDLVRESRQQDFLRWAKRPSARASCFAEQEPRCCTLFGEERLQMDHDLHTSDGLTRSLQSRDSTPTAPR